jgi:hypothetical protein
MPKEKNVVVMKEKRTVTDKATRKSHSLVSVTGSYMNILELIIRLSGRFFKII